MSTADFDDDLIEAVAFTSANSRAYLSAVFAAHREGRVVALMPSASQAGPARRNIPGVRFVDRVSFAPDHGWFDEAQSPIFSDDPAQIVFSSGTTGRAKAILLPHRALADVVSRLNDAMDVTADIREYIGVPVNFSFGFARVRAVAAAGGRSYLPEHGFNPVELAAMMARGEVNAVSAVPTLWRIALQNKEVFNDVGEAIRWIEIGSQYMSREEKEDLKTLFPRATILQHYGMTEASRSTFLDISATEGEALESVGRATGGTEIALSEDGRIMVRGPHVALGVVTGAGVKKVTDDEGWLLTNDRGEMRNGNLYFLGRADDLINCGGVKIDPEQFERRLSAAVTAPDLEIAVSSQKDALRGDRILIAYKARDGFDLSVLRQDAIKIGGSHGLTGAGAFVFAPVSEIPRTPTGKVKRRELAETAVATSSASVRISGAPSPNEAQSAVMARPAQTTLPGVASDAEARAEELRKLWEEALGINPIGLHESFYDLGGDSLSAVSVMIRMERIGLSPDVAAGIFDGKSIADLAGLVPERSSRPISPTSGAALTHTSVASSPVVLTEDHQAIVAAWEEALGVSPIGLDESFFDLGGDSLSAISVMVRMESLGVDPDIAKGIFDGQTLGDIIGVDAGGVAPSIQPANQADVGARSGDPGETTAGGLTIAGAVNAINATRGVIVAWVVFVHWAPGLFARISDRLITFYEDINVLLRFGTPGFAIVFGLGMGALRIHQFRRNPARFKKTVRTNTLILFAGVCLLSLFRLGGLWAEEDLANAIGPSRIFYSVLTFYFLLAASEGLLVRIAAGPRISDDRIVSVLGLMAVGSLMIHEVLFSLLQDAKTTGVLDLLRIQLMAKYGYFKMLAPVFIGAAIGWHFRRCYQQHGLIESYAYAGLTLSALGALLIFKAQPLDLRFNADIVQPWHLTMYVGFALLLLSGFGALARRLERAKTTGARPVLQPVFNFAIVSGMLALPIFVGHEIVLPAKDMLGHLGIPNIIAIATPLAVFGAALAYGYWRFMRLFAR